MKLNCALIALIGICSLSASCAWVPGWRPVHLSEQDVKVLQNRKAFVGKGPAGVLIPHIDPAAFENTRHSIGGSWRHFAYVEWDNAMLTIGVESKIVGPIDAEKLLADHTGKYQKGWTVTSRVPNLLFETDPNSVSAVNREWYITDWRLHVKGMNERRRELGR
jgi:hypothetical protein